MVTLYYGDQKLGQVTTNHSMSIEDILELLDIDMDEYAKSHGWDGWDGWDYEQLRMEWN